MTTHYILVDGKPVPEPDTVKWGKWWTEEFDSRRVELTKLPGGVEVSTVFLGDDYNFSGKGPPVLWETMVFGGEHDGQLRRYTSEANAKTGHCAVVRQVKRQLKRSEPKPTPDEPPPSDERTGKMLLPD